VSEEVWSAADTTPDEIDDALRGLLHRLHADNPALAPARVLNLIVVVDRDAKDEITERLANVGRYHASRTVLCNVEPDRDTLDARAIMAYEEPQAGALGIIRERVEIDLGPEHLAHLDTIVDPVVVSELPTVLWCPHGHDHAVDALLGLVDVILVDSDERPNPEEALARVSELLKSAYVVDLAWLRTTPWRERIAASFDPPRRRPALKRISGVAVRHRESSRASGLLLAGWLAARLHWDASALEDRNGSGLRGTARRGGDEVEVELAPVDLSTPGLAGVSVSCSDGFSLSLDRAQGGLCAKARSRDGIEKTWLVLGASRGEGGILGEGVRQALLRDPTYGPALEAARGFSAR
jgi:glucose-6-phosphate dehydrogenase assembly protein OpcA